MLCGSSKLAVHITTSTHLEREICDGEPCLRTTKKAVESLSDGNNILGNGFKPYEKGWPQRSVIGRTRPQP